MRAFKRFDKRGFTLVELMIVVAIIGVLAALAIYGVRRYLASAKTSEAKNTVGAITRAAVSAYERESGVNELLPDGTASTTSMHALCLSAVSAPALGIPHNTKIQPAAADNADFNTGDNTAGWKCLKFGMTQATYYQYSYFQGSGYLDAGSKAQAGTGFEAGAQGDLDGVGATSKFLRGADVRNGNVVVSTEIFVLNEFD